MDNVSLYLFQAGYTPESERELETLLYLFASIGNIIVEIALDSGDAWTGRWNRYFHSISKDNAVIEDGIITKMEKQIWYVALVTIFRSH